ncbi:hypothetical protein R1sor_019514 [Riccia sorocarpa]|uniref:Uncharacterized protein n=1 Tax=Riccia sorocarpa TaxID=122646 RepID=A0ABD3ICW0_9MARC
MIPGVPQEPEKELNKALSLLEGAKEYNIDISVEGLRRLVDFPAVGDCAKIVKPSVIEKAFFDHCGQKHKKEAWKVIAPWFSFNVNNAQPRSEDWVVDDFRRETNSH